MKVFVVLVTVIVTANIRILIQALNVLWLKNNGPLFSVLKLNNNRVMMMKTHVKSNM